MITINTHKLTLLAGATLLAVAAFFIPMDVLAQDGSITDTNTLRDIQENLGTEAQGIPRLIALGSYIVGAFFAVRALFALKGFIEAPDDNPVTKVIGFGAVSAMLILLPYIISVMAGTIGVEDAGIRSASTSFTGGFAVE